MEYCDKNRSKLHTWINASPTCNTITLRQGKNEILTLGRYKYKKINAKQYESDHHMNLRRHTCKLQTECLRSLQSVTSRTPGIYFYFRRQSNNDMIHREKQLKTLQCCKKIQHISVLAQELTLYSYLCSPMFMVSHKAFLPTPYNSNSPSVKSKDKNN